MDMTHIKNKLISKLEEMIITPKSVIGVSGGIDSAVVSYLLVRAKGKENVYGVYLPSNTNTEVDRSDAKLIFDFLGLEYHEIDIEPIIKAYENQSEFFKDKLAKGNLKARIRMSVLYGISNNINGMVVGTGNKTEIEIGYFTKYGDGGVDIEPIGDLYKTEVWGLAREIGIPKQIVDKKPSAGLWDGQTDEDDIGFTYEEVDKILLELESNPKLPTCGLKVFEEIKNKVVCAQHKKSTPPIIKVR